MYISLYIIKMGKPNRLIFLSYNILLYLYNLLNTLFILFSQPFFNLIFIYLFFKILTVLSISYYIKRYLIIIFLIYIIIFKLLYIFISKLIIILNNLFTIKNVIKYFYFNKPFTNKKFSNNI